MSSLVLDLQRSAMESEQKVSDLLRRAIVVAAKLGHHDFKEWCERELRGYKKERTPPYRRVQGQLKAWNPYNGWIPVLFPNPEYTKKFSEREIGSSIGELEELYLSPSRNLMQVPLPHDVLLKYFGESEAFRLGMVPTLLVDRSQVYGILDAVRNTILEWSLELEKKGVLGESMSFSKDEIQKASHVTYNIQNFTGVLGNVISSQVQVGDYATIASKLESLGIPQDERDELREILDRVPEASPTDRSNLAKRGLEWVARHSTTLGTLSDTIRGWFEALF